MATVNFLAALWGFSLIIIPLSLLVRPKHLKNLLRLMENETSLFLHGVLGVVLGLAMVLNYNIWEVNWKVIITVLGWLLLISGSVLLFVPSPVLKLITKFKQSNLVSLILTIIVVLGCFLIYFSFTY